MAESPISVLRERVLFYTGHDLEDWEAEDILRAVDAVTDPEQQYDPTVPDSGDGAGGVMGEQRDLLADLQASVDRAIAARTSIPVPVEEYDGGAEEDPINLGDASWYLLWCLHCHPDIDSPMPFVSAEERGKWAAAHRDGTGHDQWRVLDQPK